MTVQQCKVATNAIVLVSLNNQIHQQSAALGCRLLDAKGPGAVYKQALFNTSAQVKHGAKAKCMQGL